MPPSDDFLLDLFKDCREEMRARREIEFRLLQLLLVFYPIIVTAMATLYQSNINPTMYMILTLGAVFLTLITTQFVTSRIDYEHQTYAELGRDVQRIWRYFEMFQPGAYLKETSILPPYLDDVEKGYGQGQGHKKTIRLAWMITITVIAILLTLGVLKIIQ